MKPDDFVATAAELVQNSEERHLRAAVHAAYYGVYHLVAHHFGLDPAKYEADHQDIRARLAGLSDASKVPREIWMAKRHIRDIWAARRNADYVLSPEFDPETADEVVEICKGISGHR